MLACFVGARVSCTYQIPASGTSRMSGRRRDPPVPSGGTCSKIPPRLVYVVRVYLWWESHARHKSLGCSTIRCLCTIEFRSL